MVGPISFLIESPKVLSSSLQCSDPIPMTYSFIFEIKNMSSSRHMAIDKDMNVMEQVLMTTTK